MRSNGNGAPKSIGRRDNNKKISRNSIRIFFLALITIAVVLLVWSLNLLTSIGKESDTTSNSNSNNNDRADTMQQTTPKSIQQQQRPYPNGPKTDPKYANDRVYCMVPFIWNEEIYKVIMDTWGKRCNTIHFITDSEVAVEGKWDRDNVIQNNGKGYMHHYEFATGTFPDNIKFINMTRPWTGCIDKKSGKERICRHIWEKMWQSWIYVADHHLNEAEWFCKVDYDTYFFPENLQYYVRDQMGWDAYKEHHYFGLLLSHRLGRPEMIAGAAACWSHKTLKAIAEVYRNMPKGYQGKDRGRCEDRPDASEEISTSTCLKQKLNISAEAALDPQMRQYVMVDPYHNMITWNRTEQGEWWYWKGKPANVGQMEECCSHRPIGVHKYKQKFQIENLDLQFYGPAETSTQFHRSIQGKKEITARYVNKVRKTMNEPKMNEVSIMGVNEDNR